MAYLIYIMIMRAIKWATDCHTPVIIRVLEHVAMRLNTVHAVALTLAGVQLALALRSVTSCHAISHAKERDSSS